MSATFRYRLLVWLYNTFNAFFYGVVGGVSTLLGTETVNFIQPGTIQHFTFHQFITVCLISGVIAAVNYVKTPAGKLPSLDTEPGTIELPK